jgi:hypothetical protein
VLIAVVALWTGGEVWSLLAAILLVPLAGPLSRRVAAVSHLVRLRRYALLRQPVEPDFTLTDGQQVNWWELLAGGWTSILCHEAYRDEDLALSGAPWRALRHGSQTIPVYRLRQFNRHEGPRLFPQHILRMAGYCHLIETCEGRESPAGVVLIGDSYQGVTVLFTDQAKQDLRRALELAREKLAKSYDQRSKEPPAAAACCFGCHWGHPRRFQQDVTEIECDGELIPVYGSVPADQQLYHAPCGDRFRWIPPHELAMRLKII